MPPEAQRPPAAPPYPTRFGWPMRLLLAFLLFDMVFRSFSVLVPWADWADELEMTRRPQRLPTRAELARMRARTGPDNPRPVVGAFVLSARSLGEFLRPWPEPEACGKILTWKDGGKWAVAWLNTRLELYEGIVGCNQEWPMFSPNVRRRVYVARARLIYEDGEEWIVRCRADPEDLTSYSHWFEEKVLDHELKLKEGRHRVDDAFGYCNLLRHRHPTNDRGSALASIRLFLVRYNLPPPDVDAREWLADQTGPPARQVYSDFYVFDCKSNHGQCLVDRYP
jgi:hypothetical protein